MASWHCVQGRKFSLKGLLADGSKRVKGVASDTLAPEFEGGSMFIFRLAPQVLNALPARLVRVRELHDGSAP